MSYLRLSLNLAALQFYLLVVEVLHLLKQLLSTLLQAIKSFLCRLTQSKEELLQQILSLVQR